MKNMIHGITCTAVALLFSGVSMAQQQAAETKPTIANTKTTTAEEKPAISPNGPKTDLEKKVIPEPEQSKPVIPGGEFKPRDTRDIQYPVTHTEQTYKPAKPKLPDMQPVPAATAPKKQEAASPAKQPVKTVQQVAEQQ